MTDAPRITARSWLMIVSLGFIWGAGFPLIKIALTELSPGWVAAGRVSFAALLSVAVWGIAGRRVFLTERRDWPRLLLVGVLNTALPYFLIAWAQQYVTAGFSGVAMSTTALITLPLAHVFVPGERLTARRLAGFGTGFLGVLMLFGESAFSSSGTEFELAGRLACLAAAACYSVSSILMRRLPPIDPLALAALPLLTGAALVVPVAAIGEGGLPAMPSPAILAIVAFLGLVPTAGANLLRVLVVRSAGPVFMSLTSYQIPVWAVISGILVLGEPLHASLIAALALILAGVAISQWGALSRLFRRR